MAGGDEGLHAKAQEQSHAFSEALGNADKNSSKRAFSQAGNATNLGKKAKKAQASSTKAIVALANRKPPEPEPMLSATTDSKTLKLEFHLNLEGALLDWAVELLETNMRPMYEDGWGWDSVAKFKEMTSPKARFIVASLSGNGRSQPVGFVHYRFVADARRPVLYLYEIQVAACGQGLGIGRQLMNAAEAVGRQAGMMFVVLTVFKHNPDALKFYRKVGYSLDEGKPSTPEDCFKELCKVL